MTSTRIAIWSFTEALAYEVFVLVGDPETFLKSTGGSHSRRTKLAWKTLNSFSLRVMQSERHLILR